MRVLLDTHLLLWAVAASHRLPAQARVLLADPGVEVYCSAASLWEIGIKAALRRADFRVDVRQLRGALPEMDIQELAVTGRHTEAIAGLPPIHRDPFDRMLVAQSMTEPLILLTNDAVLAQYWDGVTLVG
jgi:PIN domain nuclease of toxin-antitoxin system